MKHLRFSAEYSAPSSELTLRAALVVASLQIRRLRGEDVGPNYQARLAHLRQIIRAGKAAA